MITTSVLDKIYIRLIQKSYRLRINTSKIISANVRQNKYLVPVESGIGLDYIYYYKESLYPIIASIAKYRKGAFIDVGANIGQMLFIMLVSDDARPYIGFEPNPFCCNYICKFIELNHLENHTIFPIGLSDKPAIGELMLNSSTDVYATTTPSFRPDGFYKKNKKIIIETGDNVIEKLKPENIAIIKIDVEGGEFEVISGIRKTIAKHKPLILFEVLPYLHIEKSCAQIRKQRIKVLEELIDQMGYIFYLIENNGCLSRKSSLKSDTPEQKTEMNFLAIHRSEQISFQSFQNSQAFY